MSKLNVELLVQQDRAYSILFGGLDLERMRDLVQPTICALSKSKIEFRSKKFIKGFI